MRTGRNRYPLPENSLVESRRGFFFQSPETLRATLDAYAAGKIELGKVPKGTDARYILCAPHTINKNGNSCAYPYTKTMLAQFLGWTSAKREIPSFAFETAFRALELIEQNLITEDRNNYDTFKDYLRFEFDVDDGHASRAIRSSKKYQILAHAQVAILPKSYSQAEKLIGIPDKDLPKVWQGVVELQLPILPIQPASAGYPRLARNSAA